MCLGETYDFRRYIPAENETITLNISLIYDLGMRLALVELKTAIGHLVLNFELSVSEKTAIPLKFKITSATPQPVDGIWVNLSPRV